MPTTAQQTVSPSTLDDVRVGFDRLRREVAKVIVGQDEIVNQIIICLLCRGHALLVGVPGLAKTLLIRTLSDVLELSFSRIQFTPDLMPSDITGTEILEEDSSTGRRFFKFVKGPLFANVILADEINRTPPKTQAALLEAMQEHHVTAGGTS
jgi:MoxR-like ATPase